ncbi:MAG: hypothetical protein ACM3U2_17195 [Deltaproteobacteria bacterium]|jgi:hypothetical protein
MYLPMQREPVQRSIVGCPSASQSSAPGGPSSGATAPGVEPSGWFDDVLGGIQKVGQVAGTVAPILGSFGI